MATSIIEKYVVMRMNAHTRRHQHDLAEWMARPEAVEQGYYDKFNADRERSENWFTTEVAKIEGDANMNYRDRATEIVKLADRRVYPAWSGEGFGLDCGKPKPECQHRECAFLRTYVGDAAASEREFASNQRLVNAELTKLDGPDWHTTRENKPADVPMTEWDRSLLSALTDPQDGSVPVPALGTAVATPSAPAVSAPAPNAPVEIAGISPDDPRYAALLDVAERSCQHCGEVRKTPRAKVAHERSCNDNPDRVSLNPVRDQKEAEEAQAAAADAQAAPPEETMPSEVPAEEPVGVGYD